MKLLIGTRNDSRKQYLGEVLKGMAFEILSLDDFDFDAYVDEDGISVIDNALKKSQSYFDLTGIPTFSIDAGLLISSFPSHEQPNLFVRRRKINGELVEMTDDEMLEYYTQKIKAYGGESKGYWKIGMSLVMGDGRKYIAEFIKHTLFVSTISSVKNEGEPLNSIQYNPKHKKFLSELSLEERASEEVELIEFIREFIESSIHSESASI